MDLLQNDVSEFFMFHFVRKDSFSALLSLASVLSETPSDLLEFPISDQFDSDGFDEVGGLRVAEQTVPQTRRYHAVVIERFSLSVTATENPAI